MSICTFAVEIERARKRKRWDSFVYYLTNIKTAGEGRFWGSDRRASGRRCHELDHLTVVCSASFRAEGGIGGPLHRLSAKFGSKSLIFISYRWPTWQRTACVSAN